MKNYIKKTILIITITPVILIGIYFITFILQNLLLTKSFESEYISLSGSHIKYATLQRCGLNILKPELTRVMEYKNTNEKDIYFYKSKHLFSQTHDEWENSYTGGTTIKNTTFPELVKMVKEDCSQFQSGYLDYTGYEDLSEQEKDDRWYEIADKNLNWSFSPASPRLTKARDLAIQVINKYRNISYMPEFIEKYGDFDEITDDEIISVGKRIEREGLDGILLKTKTVADYIFEYFNLSESQLSKIKSTYGSIEQFNEYYDDDNKEPYYDKVIEYKEIIEADIKSGAFSLD